MRDGSGTDAIQKRIRQDSLLYYDYILKLKNYLSKKEETKNLLYMRGVGEFARRRSNSTLTSKLGPTTKQMK